MLPFSFRILAEAISIASTSLQQRQSVSLTSFCNVHISEAVVRSYCVKIFAKFTGVSSGTGVSCEFCEIFKNTGCFWHLHQSRFLILILYVVNQHLRHEYVSFLSMVENGGTEDFFFTSVFLRIITFFIKI